MSIYSDINQFSPTKRSLSNDLDSIMQSISNILATPKNTRLFLPEFGSAIENLLFEPMDEITAASLYDTIIIAIEEWEPRVILDYARSSVTPEYDKHAYHIYLVFRIKGLTDINFYTYTGTLFKGER